MIDWFTVASQIVNFLILVALLKHFLYGPVIRAMDKRHDTIKQRLSSANEKKEEAEKQAEAYRKKKEEIEKTKKKILDQARSEAEDERKKRMREAREEADGLRRKWRESVERERDAFLGEVRQAVGRQSLKVARKMIQDLADEQLEAQVINVFLKSLKDLDADKRKTMKKALKDKDGRLVVRTAFELDDEQRRCLEEAVREHLGNDLALNVEVSDDLLGGVVLAAGGQRVAWTLKDYLDQAADEIEAVLEQTGGKGTTDQDAEEPRT